MVSELGLAYSIIARSELLLLMVHQTALESEDMTEHL